MYRRWHLMTRRFILANFNSFLLFRVVANSYSSGTVETSILADTFSFFAEDV